MINGVESFPKIYIQYTDSFIGVYNVVPVLKEVNECVRRRSATQASILIKVYFLFDTF